MKIFFGWKPTVIILWLFGVIFGICAVFNIWVAKVVARGVVRPNGVLAADWDVHALNRGAVENCLIAVLCLCAWYGMRRRTVAGLFAGAFSAMMALYIITARWRHWYIRNANAWSRWELLFYWLFLGYAIV